MTKDELLTELHRITTEAGEYHYHRLVVDVSLIREIIQILEEKGG